MKVWSKFYFGRRGVLQSERVVLLHWVESSSDTMIMVYDGVVLLGDIGMDLKVHS